MAKTSTIQIAITEYGDGVSSGETISLNNASAPGQEQAIALTANTDYTVAVPTGTLYMTVRSVSAGTLKGKGAAGDTGITLMVGSVNTPPAILRNASGCTIVVRWD